MDITQKIVDRHEKLLTDIVKCTKEDSDEYKQLLEKMETILPQKHLHRKKTLSGKFELMTSKGLLKPGEYCHLQKLAEQCNNIDIIKLINKAKGEISELEAQRKESGTRPVQTTSRGPLKRARSEREGQATATSSGQSKRARSESEGLSDWDSCIEKLSEGKITDAKKISANLYKGDIYPNQRQLNRLQQMRKTSHSIVSEVCKRLCSAIQSESKNISDVWPAYKFGQRDKVIFVVETNTTHVLKIDISYEYVVFSADYFGEDRKAATKESKINKDLPQSESAPLVKFIKKNAAKLFTKHRHLSYIKPSLFRQEDSNRDKHIPVYAKKQCLAFYVRRKDYTHLDEEPFESSYEGFPVVVREGAFSLQTEMKMGCEIRCSQDHNRQYLVQGKLGGFVEHPYYGLCGLTCAHVLLNAGEMNELIQRRGIQAPEPPTGIYVCSVEGSQIGRLVKVAYEDGKNGSSGMEFALFQIETGQPKSAEFFRGLHQENFVKGRAYGDTRLDNGTRVYKLGANRTEGRITGVKTMTVKTHENLGALLHSQIEVKNIQPGPFSVAGDSGSLVFVKEDDEYICIGMVVGGTVEKVDENTWEYSSVVSPIVPVLEKLGVTSFKSFVTDGLAERLRSLETSIQAVESNMRREIEKSVDLILGSFESFRNSMYVESSHFTT